MGETSKPQFHTSLLVEVNGQKHKFSSQLYQKHQVFFVAENPISKRNLFTNTISELARTFVSSFFHSLIPSFFHSRFPYLSLTVASSFLPSLSATTSLYVSYMSVLLSDNYRTTIGQVSDIYWTWIEATPLHHPCNIEATHWLRCSFSTSMTSRKMPKARPQTRCMCRLQVNFSFIIFGRDCI